MRFVVLTSLLSVALLTVWACGDDPAGGPGGSSGGQGSSGSSGPGSSGDGSSGGSSGSSGPGVDGGPTLPPVPSCTAGGGSATVATPTILRRLRDDGDEGWLGSPAIADLDNDGKPEIIAVRGGRVIAWKSDGNRAFSYNTAQDRIWASPIVGDFTGDAKLEVAVAARAGAWIVDSAGALVRALPPWQTEIRTVAAGDVDGNGSLDLVVGARKGSGATTDIVTAYHADGSVVPGFPPVASGVAGCVPNGPAPNPCYFAGLYDQNLAIGDLDGDGKQDLILPMDNAYASFFKGTGVAFDTDAYFTTRRKVPGLRFLHDYAQAKRSVPEDGDTNQAHFTNTPPAIADIDKDGKYEVVMVGSVQDADQADRLRGVALWVVRPDGTRPAGWESPFHVPAYVMGLNDGFARSFDNPVEDPNAGNLVGLTNQVTVADIDPTKPGLEMIFAGFDGKIHAVAANKTEIWTMAYAENGRALTGGVVVGDLSGDGAPEVVFTTYSPDQGGGSLFILDANGRQLHKIALPTRGSMAVPTIGDVDGAGKIGIVVSLKDENAANENVLVFEVPGAKANCLPWPTGRGNNLRNGWVR